MDVESYEDEVLRGVCDSDWKRIRQVVVEVHGAPLREAVVALLGRHYQRVSYHPDEELRACGLEHGIVAARTRASAAPTQRYAEDLAMHKLSSCALTLAAVTSERE